MKKRAVFFLSFGIEKFLKFRLNQSEMIREGLVKSTSKNKIR